jgi:hypothetical protein
MNRTLLILGLGLVTIWDTITTIYGTYTILGHNTLQIILSVLFAVFLSVYLLHTIPIIKNPSIEMIPVGAKVLWFLAILYDLFTAYTGNFDLVLGDVGGSQKIIIAIGLTIFICSAPIGLSQLLYGSEKN